MVPIMTVLLKALGARREAINGAGDAAAHAAAQAALAAALAAQARAAGDVALAAARAARAAAWDAERQWQADRLLHHVGAQS